jgi:hypothetical protein
MRHARDDDLAAETVEGAALTLQRVDDVHRGDRLALGVLGVRDRVADHVLEEDLEDAASLLVDEAGDTLDATPAGETTDRWLRDALDVVAQHLAMTLRATLPEPLASLATAGHDDEIERTTNETRNDGSHTPHDASGSVVESGLRVSHGDGGCIWGRTLDSHW